MRRRLALALSALIIVAVPIVLVGNALLVLVNPWLVHTEYALPGFPDDSLDLSDGERTDLAVSGVRSVRIGSDDVDALREARLPDGDPAFDADEIQHMDDVRGLVSGAVVAWATALLLGAGAVLALRRLGEPAPFRVPWTRASGAVGSALVGGAYLSVAAIALAAPIMAVDFEFFFDGFHGVFFEGDTWQFDDDDTLLNLYPEVFWGIAAGALIALIVLQAAVLSVVCSRRR
jgi:hypothetical protein